MRAPARGGRARGAVMVARRARARGHRRRAAGGRGRGVRPAVLTVDGPGAAIVAPRRRRPRARTAAAPSSTPSSSPASRTCSSPSSARARSGRRCRSTPRSRRRPRVPRSRWPTAAAPRSCGRRAARSTARSRRPARPPSPLPRRSLPRAGFRRSAWAISGTAYVAYLGAGDNVDRRRAPGPHADGVRRAARVAERGADRARPAGARGPAIAGPPTPPGSSPGPRSSRTASTHVFVRRVSAAGPSPVLDDATVPSLGGAAGGSADSPPLGVDLRLERRVGRLPRDGRRASRA